MAFAFALALSAPLHADTAPRPTQQAIDDCQAAYSNKDAAALCVVRASYSARYELFCRHVVFRLATPPPSDSELFRCAAAAVSFAVKAFMDARGEQEAAGDEG